MDRVAALVLAAGGSTRMGSPKQLLQLDGKSLVRQAVETALASSCAATFVMLGAHADAVAHEIADLPCTRIDNPHWQNGIGSSISVGVEVVAAAPQDFDAVLITLCDQPAVTSALLNRLVTAAAGAPAGLVACVYAETVGVPALFARRHFDALRALNGEQGGKVLLAAHADAVVRIAFPPAALDVDTRDDYARAAAARTRSGVKGI